MIFYFLRRYLDSWVTAVALDPKPEKLQENVILRFRNLKVRTRSKSVSIVYIVIFYSEYMILMFIFRVQIREGDKKCMFWSGVSER